jgi:4-phospho-D-threonate 3-dehydrogenase / 4-phospho-D-erythronate 3-dehydrogenase
MKPKIAITIGDPAGIGPEITLKSLNYKKIYNKCNPVVLGDYRVVSAALDILGIDLEINRISSIKDCKFHYGVIDLIDYNNVDSLKIEYGTNNPIYGKAAVEYTIAAAEMCMKGSVDAMVSAPLNKKSMHMAGFNFEGQTQLLAKHTNSKEYAMILILGNIRVMLLSNHMSLLEAIGKVKRDRIYDLIILAYKSLKDIGIPDPIIAVAGLNPHASEGGLFGNEESNEIIPAIKKAVKENISVLGPIPADVVFSKAKKGEYDLVIAMYHDQANIPLKTLGFGKIVTFIAGLPLIRTSVGHGTAFDIAGKNLADENNLVDAIMVATYFAVLKNKDK